jgi:glycine dehydrogenase subunit 1
MRYRPLTDDDRAAMLARVGVASIDDLFADLPADRRLNQLIDLPVTQSEI